MSVQLEKAAQTEGQTPEEVMDEVEGATDVTPASPVIVDIFRDEESNELRGIVDIALHPPTLSKGGKREMLAYASGKTGMVLADGREVKYQISFHVDVLPQAKPAAKVISF